MSEIIKCKLEACTFKKSENDYCGKHQLLYFLEETAKINKKPCSGHKRGCRLQLDVDYEFAKCENCRAKERICEHKRKVIVEKKPVLVVEENIEKILCKNCNKYYTKNNFIKIGADADNYSDKDVTKKCLTCREKAKVIDHKRDKEHINELARKNAAKPERIEVKKEWRAENVEKVAASWMKSRATKINDNVEEYLKMNNENIKKWRDENPKKVVEINKQKRENINYSFVTYKRSADQKNINFELTKEQFIELTKQNCYYCNELQEKGFNGIDRKDCTIGYIESNCVSCCKICNFLKSSLSEQAFIRRVEHILTYNKKINGNLYPELFPDHKSNSYNEYKKRATEKLEIDFELSEIDYLNIIINPCYLCGKKNDETHRNGIDRIDNAVGYVLYNVKSCCFECNVMKKAFSIETIFDKFIKIHNNKGLIVVEDKVVEDKNIEDKNIEDKNIENNIIEDKVEVDNEQYKIIAKHLKTKTKEEIREKNRLYKEKQRNKLKEKYGNEEYLQMRAKEIAEFRKLKKNQNA